MRDGLLQDDEIAAGEEDKENTVIASTSNIPTTCDEEDDPSIPIVPNMKVGGKCGGYWWRVRLHFTCVYGERD